MASYDRDEEAPESRSLSARMWSTSDRRTGRPNPNSLNVTNSARAWTTSTRTTTPTRIERMRERLRRLRQDTGQGGGVSRNPRTNRWTNPLKPAPIEGTVREARERAEANRRANRFRPGTSRIADQVARRRGGFQSTGGTARGGFKRLTAIQNGRRGGRPRTGTPRRDPVMVTSTDPIRNRGRFTSETARQAGARSTVRKTQAARVNARRPRKRTVG